MDQALNSQKTPHTSPLRASYGMSFVSILMKNDRVIKGFYCNEFGDYCQEWMMMCFQGNVSSYLVERYGFSRDCKVIAFTGDNPGMLNPLKLKWPEHSVSLTLYVLFFSERT